MNEAKRAELNQANYKYYGYDFRSKRVGDFRYKPSYGYSETWVDFFDEKGNSVLYGDRYSGKTDVVIKIKPESLELLKPRIMNYLGILVGRHHEELHESGRRQFYGVTITLPTPLPTHFPFEPDFEVVIHTGSGRCYDQDEIAYEVMAALSGLPLLKVVAPVISHYDFVRQDRVDDKQWLSYILENIGIRVQFNYIPDSSVLTVFMYKHEKENWDKFKELMFNFFEKHISQISDKKFVRDYGVVYYPPNNDYIGFEKSQNQILVDIESGSTLSFNIGIPYENRISFAEELMMSLTSDFAVDKEDSLA